MDGRASSASRMEFYRGWDEEDRFRIERDNEQEIATAKAVLSKLREFAANL